ncbi:MAG TPA: heparinase II/III family protein [Armatimonadota bacterium]|nr:heparinase II/III family protein [Armatimonadota bacterium]
MRHRAGSVLVLLPVLVSGQSPAEAAGAALDPARVEAIVAMLPEAPTGLGRPADDRAAWQELAARPAFQGVVARAEEIAASPLPDLPDELFLDFSRTGNRRRWEMVNNSRRGRLAPLVLGECIEDGGRFIAPIEELVRALCAEPTWVMPAHDGTLANFEGKVIDIDLASSALGRELATAAYLLGDRLSEDTRALLRDNLTRRIFDPFIAMVRGDRTPNWWLLTTNNWNAVCLAGVTGAALAGLESRGDRALVVAAAEALSLNFLKGFTADGYCSEGVGYWNYGFGHYVELAETIGQATGGQIDLFERDAAKSAASYATRIQIVNGVCPAFADCSITEQPSAQLVEFLDRRYGWGLRQYEDNDMSTSGGGLSSSMLYSFPNSATLAPPAPAAAAGPGLRSWFEQAGILICRPAPGGDRPFAVALKGGHNEEHHNHNDVGSYVVVLGDQPVLLDPGAEVYTKRTFSAQRYDSSLLNSFGHPVPLVGGQLQRAGREARADVLAAEFSDAADTLTLDITSAYRVEGLRTLTRRFTYSREGSGSLEVSDHATFVSPQTFETALITRGTVEQSGPTTLRVTDGGQSVEVEIRAPGDFALVTDDLRDDSKEEPVAKRVGIRLVAPVTDATVTATIRPAE